MNCPHRQPPCALRSPAAAATGTGRAGFTLVELLVVIGIIALLIGILLPVLGRAREQANTAKCAANMRSALQAMTIYTTQYKGWLPGPTTSGMVWPRSKSTNMTATATSADTTPIQNMDWVSPTFGMTFRWPENEVERLKMMFNTQLACPSNNLYFTRTEDSPITTTDALTTSYSAVVQFFTFPSLEKPFGQTEYPRIASDMYIDVGLAAPADYVPKISRIGPPARKVFLVEGTRYIETTGSGMNSGARSVSFNGYRHQISGGNFMICGPFTNASHTPYQLTVSPQQYTGQKLGGIAATGAWRHKGKMNLAFFDGHVEARGPSESIQVELFTPKGTVITDKTYTLDPLDNNKQVVQ